MKDTKIEWTDATWNPIIGCTRVSEGCRNCYAEGIAVRFGPKGSKNLYSGLTQIVNGHPQWTGKIVETKQLLNPLKWRPGRPIYDATTGKRVGRDTSQPLRIFVNSMSDLFHENVTDEQRDRIFAVMVVARCHIYQVLTKRAANMLRYLTSDGRWLRIQLAAEEICRETRRDIDVLGHRRPEFLDHIWLGVSVENQAAADERVPLLLQTPAAKRFLSCEPLLGPVDLDRFLFSGVLGGELLDLLHWVIVGGESGSNARPMHPDWARWLLKACQAAEIPYFFKQWGEWLPFGQAPESTLTTAQLNQDLGWPMYRVGKKAAGAMLDGREYREFPESVHA